MPSYTFNCKKCGTFEIVTTIAKYNGKAKCPHCKKQSKERVYSVDLSGATASVKKADSELSTVGDIANRNRDNFSDDYKEHLRRKHNAYRDEAPLPELPSGMSYMNKRL